MIENDERKKKKKNKKETMIQLGRCIRYVEKNPIIIKFSDLHG